MRAVQYGRSQSYQPLAEVTVTTAGPPATLRERRLDLGTAVASWQASAGDPDGRRSSAEVYVSAPAGALVARYDWSRPTDVAVAVIAAHAEYGRSEVRAAGSELIMTSRMPSLV